MRNQYTGFVLPVPVTTQVRHAFYVYNIVEHCTVSCISNDTLGHLLCHVVRFFRRYVSLCVQVQTKLSSCSFLPPLTKTWQDSNMYEIVEEGFRERQGHYSMYVFTLLKLISTDPWRYLTKKICFYYVWWPTSQPIHIPRVITSF